MSNKVAAYAATPDPTYGRQAPKEPPEHGAPLAVQAAEEDPGDMRLVIEEDQESGLYVYKTVNRRTGEVVLQLPREDVLKLREEIQYVAGTLIRTRA